MSHKTHEPASLLRPCRLREGANREILGIIVSAKSEGEAGGVSWWVSAQPSSSPAPNGGRKVPDGHTQCPILPACRILPCSSSFSSTLFPFCFRGFQPLSFLPSSLLPFSSSSSFNSSSSSPSLVWAHGRWRELPESVLWGFQGVLCPPIHLRHSTHHTPTYAQGDPCWGSGLLSSESQSHRGALTVPFYRDRETEAKTVPHTFPQISFSNLFRSQAGCWVTTVNQTYSHLEQSRVEAQKELAAFSLIY